MALFLGLAASLGGLALGLFDAFLAVAPRSFGFRNTALFFGAHFGSRQGARSRAALVLGQFPQHDA